MGQPASPLPHPDILRALAERGLIFELMAHPDQLQEAAVGIEAVDGLTVVVEHAGWPRSADDGERALWRAGMAALAEVGDRVHCKLSGLAMPLGSMAAPDLAPWIETAIDLFGVDRCCFASNFPVDGMHGTFDDLYTAYATVVTGLDDEARDKLFAANATRLYRL
jgi:predicted TIM-barrel fold metal-dependent hydrolase